jgi:pyrimidine precursor biosynthesis enzyme
LTHSVPGNEKFLPENPEKVTKFLRAYKKVTDFVLADPNQAYADYVDFKPIMGTPLNRKIFERSFAYFSKDMKNVKRDWVRTFIPLRLGSRKGLILTRTTF